MRTPPRDDDSPSILVLTLHTGGHYYGETLSGVLREAAAAGRHVVAVETRDPGGPHGDRSWGPAFHHPLARRRVGGVVCIANAATPEHLDALRADGIPVVLASEVHDGFDGPVAMPDNTAAIRAAVQHLVDHGHTRIGFAGSLDIRDFRERHAAYLAAVEEHGLGVPGELCLPTGDYSVEGGARAAEVFLAHPHRPTAVVTATDANAIGFARRVRQAGVRVPEDVAVVGFDDAEDGAYATPSLSSVGQRFRDVGALATRLLLRQMAGEHVPAGSHSPETLVLSRRASCGCRVDTGVRAELPTGGPPGRAPSAPRLPRAADPVPLPPGVHSPAAAMLGALPPEERASGLAAVRRVEVLARSRGTVGPADGAAIVADLKAATGGPERLRGALTDLIEHVLYLDPTGPDDRAGAGTAAVLGLLWELQARAHRAGEHRLDTSALELERIAASLLRQDADHLRSLAWLSGTHVRAGVLALWQGDPADGVLEVAGVHDPDGLTEHRTGEQIDVCDFPSAVMTAAGDAGVGEMCVVVPVASRTHEWGLLALIGRIDTTSIREPYHQMTELLYWALERERLQLQVRHAALYDEVTGLANRRLFLERLDAAIARSRRSGAESGYAVVFLDLDGFKLVNDSLGHLAGDDLLRTVGERLRTAVRAVDTAARFGGDEFAVLLVDPESEELLSVSDRLQQAVAQPVTLGEHEVHVTASIGIATSETGYTDAQDVLRDADTAMYQSKETRGGTATVFDPGMHERASARLRARAELRRALEEEQFVVHYQPIVPLDGSTVTGFEALVRWQHPERGLVGPGDFLPAMEEDGTIIALGSWVTEQVCSQVAAWRARTGTPVRVSVNVSHREFWAADVVERLAEVTARHGLPASAIALEITESVVGTDTDQARHILERLRGLGFGLHVDDFGTGQSSLHALRSLPVDTLKLDGSFVRDLAASPRAEAIVRAIVTMASGLHMDVVAEQVETSAQADHLTALGCANAQGWLYARALPAEEAGLMLGERPASAAVAGWELDPVGTAPQR